jgi:hypothetical protein
MALKNFSVRARATARTSKENDLEEGTVLKDNLALSAKNL